MRTMEEKIITRSSEIWLDEEGILRVLAKDGAEIDLEEAKACFRAYRKLGLGAGWKTLQLLDAGAGVVITPEARDYVSKHGKAYFTASAVVSKSLAVRLVINFFNSFYKQDVPLRMFSTEEEALAWLRKFR